MPNPYTQNDLIVRVLARLGETVFDTATGAAGDQPAAPAAYTNAQLVDRILARLGETGFDIADTSAPAGNFTTDQLVTRVLTRLGEVGFGETAEPEAANRVRAALPAIFSELVRTRVYLPIGTAIPPEAMDALSAVVASKVSNDFALSQDEITLAASRAQGAQDILRRLIFHHQQRVLAALPGLRAELVFARVYSQALADPLPAEAADAFTAVAALRMAGEFGVGTDRFAALQAEAQAGEARLRRIDVKPYARVATALPAIFVELYDDGIYAFPLDDTIKPAAFDPLSAIVAARMIDDFQVPLDRAAFIASQAQAAEAKLRRMRAQPYVSGPRVGEYF